jgi:hypothetical protein
VPSAPARDDLLLFSLRFSVFVFVLLVLLRLCLRNAVVVIARGALGVGFGFDLHDRARRSAAPGMGRREERHDGDRGHREAESEASLFLSAARRGRQLHPQPPSTAAPPPAAPSWMA